MTTIKLSAAGDVPITVPDGLSRETLEGFKPLNRWLGTLTRSLERQRTSPPHPFHADPYSLHKVTIQSFDLFGGQRLGFLKLQADVSNGGGGESLPGSVFLRGPSVAMLVLLVPDDVTSPEQVDAERRVVLTVQPRVPAGGLGFVELPAGMVDDSGTFAGAAAKEIEEELGGLVIEEAQLTNMSELAGAPDARGKKTESDDEYADEEDLPEAVYPSAGGCDEFVPVFVHERRVPRRSLDDWAGKLTGLRDHGEKITLRLVRMRDLWREGRRDAKCLAAVALWEGLRREVGGAFDSALEDITHIIHAGSPVPMPTYDPMTEVFQPTLRNTENVLAAALQTPTVQRVVITSSIAYDDVFTAYITSKMVELHRTDDFV
ncbi:hypothetical protein LQW54_007862 [Pestalotiopsis sp. IQ-011]